MKTQYDENYNLIYREEVIKWYYKYDNENRMVEKANNNGLLYQCIYDDYNQIVYNKYQTNYIIHEQWFEYDSWGMMIYYRDSNGFYCRRSYRDGRVSWCDGVCHFGKGSVFSSGGLRVVNCNDMEMSTIKERMKI